jgi:hypothetical protein
MRGYFQYLMFILLSYWSFSSARLPFTHTNSSDQLILCRVIAKGSLDCVAYTFDLVPHTAVDDIALVALVSQLRFQCDDLRVERRRRADFGGG